MISASLKILNDFIEDSTVIIATPYLLGRGRILSALFQSNLKKHDAVRLGLIFGAVAVTEVLFPEERYPYLTDTLTTGFATLTGGPIVGFISALVVGLASLLLQPWPNWFIRVVGLVLTVVVCSLFHRASSRYGALNSFFAGLSSQGAVQIFNCFAAPAAHGIGWHGIGAVFGNALGMVITTTVFREAWVRVNSDRNRLAAEQAKALAAKAQLAATSAKLAALRGRIHPHFLYNALTSISGLCVIAPDDAEEAAAQLGELMRRTLEGSTASTIPLSTELEYVRVYLTIEQRRFGDRFQLDWKVDEDCAQIAVPPFSIQTLVENAVRHGAARVLRPVTITVTVRKRNGHALIAVKDNGGGLQRAIRSEIVVEEERAVHGLQILANQLTILYGPSARLRLFSTPDAGTLIVFAAALGRSAGHAD